MKLEICILLLVHDKMPIMVFFVIQDIKINSCL